MDAARLADEVKSDDAYEKYKHAAALLVQTLETVQPEARDGLLRGLAVCLDRCDALKPPPPVVTGTYAMLAGMETAKKHLREGLEFPKKFPRLFPNGPRWRAVLLYGPPGTGKTSLAEAAAAEAKMAFFAFKASDMIVKWQGESEQNLNAAFAEAIKAAPSIIFLDEIDTLGSKRTDNELDSAFNRIRTALFLAMDNAKKTPDVFIFGATNLPWSLDESLRRRFEQRLYIGLPTLHARHTMLVNGLARESHALSDEELNTLAERMHGFSGDDVCQAIKTACEGPLQTVYAAKAFKSDDDETWIPCTPCETCVAKEVCATCGAFFGDMHETQDSGRAVGLPPLTLQDFDTVKPSTGVVNPKYEEWTGEFGKSGG